MNGYEKPIEATLRIIGGKWKIIILCHLIKGAKRPKELKQLIPEISSKMLRKQLHELQKDGIVTRHLHGEFPRKVDYSLTDYGYSLESTLNLLTSWGYQCIDRKNN